MARHGVCAERSRENVCSLLSFEIERGACHLSIIMKIAAIEQTLNYLMEYEQGKLYEEFNRERERVH
ncbi:hypothetical protein DXK91_03120 [Parageobacillus toebii]|nr:hypothetical protein DCC82_16030 [Geobacillus sp. LYN3]RDV23335.1 hypothetical protein DXK91_03120 [Parageobacillus toebii]TXK86665.1 hypothetical protein FVE68_13415 [Geobacillus sp. AYS3]